MRHGLFITLSHPLSCSTRCTRLLSLSRGEDAISVANAADHVDNSQNPYKAAIHYFLSFENQLVVTLLVYILHTLFAGFCDDGSQEPELMRSKLFFLEAVHAIPSLGCSRNVDVEHIDWTQLQFPLSSSPTAVDPATELVGVENAAVDEESWKKKRHGLHMKKLVSNGLFNPDFLHINMLVALNNTLESSPININTLTYLELFCSMLSKPQKYSLTVVQVNL